MKKRNRALRAAALAVSVFIATGGLIQTTASAAIAPVTRAAPDSIARDALPAESIASIRMIAANRAVGAAQELLSSSLNHTMRDSTRQALANAISAANSDLAATLAQLGFTASFVGSEKAAANSRLAQFVGGILREINALARDQSTLTTASVAVKASEAARTLQLQVAARIAAESYHEVVWTSGFQAQIDACRGAVNLTAAYHVRVIGEEWQCGGARFPREGTLVRLSGIISGLYRVGPVVAVLNAYVDKSRDIPRGYSLLYQTCRNGNAHTETFTELIPVG
ncbi:MAG TPA: hypothetical protein VHX87_11445 [Galbitalea sp.]|jgi:hypothetical protein|nr:hypothetical protein [Galbitalea sp.]